MEGGERDEWSNHNQKEYAKRADNNSIGRKSAFYDGICEGAGY